MKKVQALVGVLMLSGMVSLGIAEEQQPAAVDPVKPAAMESAEKPMKKKMMKKKMAKKKAMKKAQGEMMEKEAGASEMQAMYKCEHCNYTSNTPGKCPKCNMEMKKM